jgi:hypothetical protein
VLIFTITLLQVCGSAKNSLVYPNFSVAVNGFDPDAEDPTGIAWTLLSSFRVVFYGLAVYSLDWNIYLVTKSLVHLFGLKKKMDIIMKLMLFILAAQLVVSTSLLVVVEGDLAPYLSFIGFEGLFTLVFLVAERAINHEVEKYKKMAGDDLRLDGIKRQLFCMVACNITTILTTALELVYNHSDRRESLLHVYQIAFGADIAVNLLFLYFTFKRSSSSLPLTYCMELLPVCGPSMAVLLYGFAFHGPSYGYSNMVQYHSHSHCHLILLFIVNFAHC